MEGAELRDWRFMGVEDQSWGSEHGPGVLGRAWDSGATPGLAGLWLVPGVEAMLSAELTPGMRVGNSKTASGAGIW